MANLSQRTGTTPVNTRISLANNTASNVQNFNGYDSQELIGHVFIDGTTDYRAAVKVTVVKNGAGVYEVAATDIAGDDISGSPIVTFSMSGSILQATLPNITGFSSAYIDYHLVSPKLNAQYPLSVDAGQVVSGTLDSSVLPEATSSALGAVKKKKVFTLTSDTVSGDATYFTFNGLETGKTYAIRARGVMNRTSSNTPYNIAGRFQIEHGSIVLDSVLNTSWRVSNEDHIFATWYVFSTFTASSSSVIITGETAAGAGLRSNYMKAELAVLDDVDTISEQAATSVDISV